MSTPKATTHTPTLIIAHLRLYGFSAMFGIAGVKYFRVEVQSALWKIMCRSRIVPIFKSNDNLDRTFVAWITLCRQQLAENVGQRPHSKNTSAHPERSLELRRNVRLLP